MNTNYIPLIDRIALESYYATIKGNQALFSSEGLTLNENDNISLIRPIDEANINEVIKSLHYICDSARTDFDFVKEKKNELHSYKIEGKITNFRDYKLCRDGSGSSAYGQSDVVNMAILHLYAVDLYTGLSAKNIQYKIPILFTLINHNGTTSVLLLKSSISLSNAFKTTFKTENEILYKIIPLSTTLLSDIADYVVNECFNKATDSLITISYNKIGHKYSTLNASEYLPQLKRVLIDNDIPTDILSNLNEITSLPVIDFSNDFSKSELEISRILTKNEHNLLEMVSYEEFKNSNNLNAVVLTTTEASRILIDSDFDFHEDFTYTINGRAYTIESDKYVETPNGYEVELVVRAENEYAINRIGGLELIPFAEKASSFEDTLLNKTTNAIKDIATFTNNARKTTINSIKNKKEALDYLRICDNKVDTAFKVFVSVLSGVTTGAVMGTAIGALTGAMTLKDQVSKKVDKEKAKKDMSKLYNNHISFLDEKISEAKANDSTKLAIRFEKGKLAYEQKLKKLNLAVEKQKQLEKIKSKYKKPKNPYNK